MKGLLLKDLLLIKNQKRSIFVSAVMVIFFMFLNKNRASAFGVMFLSLILITYALGSINYDDDSNGNSFLNTLPFSRREYVQEKYLLSILSSLAAGVISSLLMGAGLVFQGPGSGALGDGSHLLSDVPEYGFHRYSASNPIRR